MTPLARALCLPLLAAGCMSIPAPPSRAVPHPEGGTQHPELAAICVEGWEATLLMDPLWATKLGDRLLDFYLGDNTPETSAGFAEGFAGLVARLETIDPAGLSHMDRLTRDSLLRLWRTKLAIHECGIDLDSWNLNPRGGPQNEFLSLEQPVEDDWGRMGLVSRWQGWTDLFGPGDPAPMGMPQYLDQAGRNLLRGLAHGRVASHTAAQRTLEQLDAILATPPADSPLMRAAKSTGNGSFEREVLAIVRDEIYPAFGRYRDVIVDEVLPNARPDDRAGVMHVPGGEAYYRLAIREHTSLDLAPEEIHAIGLREVARVRAEMSALGTRVFGTDDVAAIQERLRTDPALHFETAAEIEAMAAATLARAEAALGASVFGRLPATPCAVVVIPAHEAPSTTIAYYEPPAADGSRGGRYYVNTYEPTTRPRYDAEVLAFHEAVPGHHTQIALSQETEGLPALRAYLGDNAFVEGWALYSERLADELGLYSSDLDRLGMLSFDAWRACRLVVDTGLHAMGWTRDEAIAYMTANTLLAENNVVNEVDRYIAWPGQALGYKLGQLEILRLRALARARLGADFSLAEFHDRVLGNGALALEVLADEIERWLAGVDG